MTEPDPSSPAGVDARPRRSPLARGAIWFVVASFVGIWGYVMYLSVFVGRAEPRDRLADTSWVETAEDTCAEARARIGDLDIPFAFEVDGPAERADDVDLVTAELEVMVRRLRGLVPPSDPAEARAVSRWLDDWSVFNEDRREYAQQLRGERPGRDPSDPFSTTDKDGYQIDVVIEDFAVINRMESCAPPDDVG